MARSISLKLKLFLSTLLSPYYKQFIKNYRWTLCYKLKKTHATERIKPNKKEQQNEISFNNHDIDFEPEI